MARPGDRRPLITDHAIAVLARGGARALTHQAVDRAAGLPAGSTSYYFRTRRDLIVATIGRIRKRSRESFDQSLHELTAPVALTPESAATFMERQLLLLTGRRREDALAVFSLLPEVEGDAELRTHLASCLFSRVLAAQLLATLGQPDGGTTALDLIDFLTGILFGLLFGLRRVEGPGATSIAETLQRFLAANLDTVMNFDTEECR